jgi:hypothetical protein
MVSIEKNGELVFLTQALHQGCQLRNSQKRALTLDTQLGYIAVNDGHITQIFPTHKVGLQRVACAMA